MTSSFCQAIGLPPFQSKQLFQHVTEEVYIVDVTNGVKKCAYIKCQPGINVVFVSFMIMNDYISFLFKNGLCKYTKDEIFLRCAIVAVILTEKNENIYALCKVTLQFFNHDCFIIQIYQFIF